MNVLHLQDLNYMTYFALKATKGFGELYGLYLSKKNRYNCIGILEHH